MKKILILIIVAVLSVSMIGCSDGKSVTDSQEYQNLKQEYDKLKNEIAKTGIDSDNIDKKLEDIDNALKEMEQATSENNGYMNIKKGQVIEFGSYDGDKDKFNRKEPIEWIVLDVDEDESAALLLSKYCLEKQEWNGGIWETCSLRKWLNDEFYDEAFSSSEKQRILLTTIENTDNQYDGTPIGNDTKDRVFLLSYNDVLNSEYGFSDNPDEKDVNRRSAFAEKRGVKEESKFVTADGEKACCWLLRTRCKNNKYNCIVKSDGKVDLGVISYTDYSDGNYDGVRPALYINLKS